MQGLGDKTGGWVDVAGGANGNKEITICERIANFIHVTGHFTKPDDVGAHAACLFTFFTSAIS